MRKFSAFVLLGVLTLVGIGGAALGAVQSKSGTALDQAVKNTLGARNFSEYLVERTPQGNEQVSLVFQAPDRLAGWTQSLGRRTYLYFIGTTVYQAVTRPARAGTPTVFYKQQTTGAVNVDPAHKYLSFATCPQPSASPGLRCTSSRNGSVTTVRLSQGGQSETLTYTVTGNYVSDFKAVASGATIVMTISKVGTSPSIELPKKFTITTTPPAQG